MGLAFMETCIWMGGATGPLIVGYVEAATGDLRFAIMLTSFTPLILLISAGCSSPDAGPPDLSNPCSCSRRRRGARSDGALLISTSGHSPGVTVLETSPGKSWA